jgi:glycosyltransferase involved in cell wall biosynthesis
MPNVVILQRVVPSYRLAIYERLWTELGWTVAYGRNLGTDGMSLQNQAPFLKGFDFLETRLGMIKVPVDQIIRDLKPDAIIAEGALRMSSTWELIARRKFAGGPKLYFWSIGYNASRSAEAGAKLSRQWLYPTTFRHADGCLTYGPDGQAFLEPRLGGKPVFVAHNSIDMDYIRKFRDATPALPRRGFPELVSVGRLTPGKDFVTLVKSFHLILRQFPDAHLTIIGDGPDHEALRKASAPELDRRIHLTGALYDESGIAGHMNRADAFVIAGRVGLAINHALGYNLPVICFRRTAKGPFHGSEITHLKQGVTGYMVEDYDAAAFADEVVTLFRARRDIKARHRDSIEAYVGENLSVDLMVGGFHKINAHLHSTASGRLHG